MGRVDRIARMRMTLALVETPCCAAATRRQITRDRIPSGHA
jgi:hypothetical protein